LHTKTKAKVLLLALLPREFENEKRGNQVKSINALIAKYDNGNSTRFLNMWDKFVGSTVDTVKTNLYLDDKLHLNGEGYKVWAATMDPLLKQMMG
jgi:lysophospholipase L1-like esterase